MSRPAILRDGFYLPSCQNDQMNLLAELLNTQESMKNFFKRMNTKEINTEQNEQEKVQNENAPDVQPVDLPAGQAGISSHAEVEKNPVAELEEELAMTKDKLLRLYSEFDNYKKRTLREKIEFSKMAGAELVLAMLPVLDDFERAMKSMTETNQEVSLIEGVELIYTKLKSTLEQKGLKEMKSAGENFDPDLHDALSNIETEDKKLKGKVVEEIQKGYYLNGIVLRHAKVIVGS